MYPVFIGPMAKKKKWAGKKYPEPDVETLEFLEESIWESIVWAEVARESLKLILKRAEHFLEFLIEDDAKAEDIADCEKACHYLRKTLKTKTF